MKHLIRALLMLLSIVPVTVFAFDLRVAPHAQLNLGDVLSTGFPRLGTNTTGVTLSTPINFEAAGKLTLAVDMSLRASVDASFTAFSYDVYAIPTITYTIQVFSISGSMYFDFLSNASNWTVVQTFVVNPAVRLSVDKTQAIIVNVKTFVNVANFNLGIAPRIIYSHSPFTAFAQVMIPNLLTSPGQDLAVKADISWTRRGITLGASCEVGGINSSTRPVSVTPALRIAYGKTLKF
jgi:hypothetical protein